MRTLTQALLLLVLLVVVAFFAFGWWAGRSQQAATARPAAPTATTGIVDTSAARARGAELAEKAASATAKVEETVNDARLTAKIKAKMALDDYVKARSIDVTTNGSTVTLSGKVATPFEHDRAVRLARETVGVTRVIDQLQVGK
jgi:cytoskeletal protein RodZ